jgi:hypothetical protein
MPPSMKVRVPTGFLRQRLNGTVAWTTVFWRDTLGVGSLINLVFGFAALMLLTLDVNRWLALALHLVPLPWNVFLVMAVRRAAGRPAACLPVAVAWFVLMLVV